ncbi:hypothetical protein PRZ48_003343 [Zasmidium cellare]|uniref:Uncharacterized protein n=1 Tax=Zasmidium cellare TaxID=395010 RepID=A0ABR0EWB6_ZASCE|nr:hypothetical protein PRZ48_003343 [Zasmidium cellare]
MVESREDESSTELTALNILDCIKDTWLGNELICSGITGTAEHIFGESAALLDDVESYSDGEGLWHDESCPCSETNGLYAFFRERPCICEVQSEIDDELIAALPSDSGKLSEAITALLDYGTGALDCLLHDDSLAWEAPIWHFLRFAQKLDDVVLAICRNLVKTTTKRDAMKIFDALKKARKALKAHHKVFRHVYLYHSMAFMIEHGAEDTSYLVFKVIDGCGLPDELVEMIREYYIEVRAEEMDLVRRQERYYNTYRNRSDLDQQYSRSLKLAKSVLPTLSAG